MSLLTRRDRQDAHADARIQQTIAVFLKTVEVYFERPLPLALIEKVQTGCNEFAAAQTAAGLEFNVGRLFAEVARIVDEFKQLEIAKKAQAEAVLAAGSLPIL